MARRPPTRTAVPAEGAGPPGGHELPGDGSVARLDHCHGRLSEGLLQRPGAEDRHGVVQ